MTEPREPVDLAAMLKHVGCGSLDEFGKCEICDSIRRELALVRQQREALEDLDRWCDERRNGPTVTTLGQVQARIALALARSRDERKGAAK